MLSNQPLTRTHSPVCSGKENEGRLDRGGLRFSTRAEAHVKTSICFPDQPTRATVVLSASSREGPPCWTSFSSPLPCTCALEMCIRTHRGQGADRFRSPAGKASARFRRRLNSTRNPPSRPVKAGKSRRTSKPGFRPLHQKNARGTKNGSNFLRNRAASEHAIFHRPSSNDGPISNRSLATVRLPTVGNHSFFS